MREGFRDSEVTLRAGEGRWFERSVRFRVTPPETGLRRVCHPVVTDTIHLFVHFSLGIVIVNIVLVCFINN